MRVNFWKSGPITAARRGVLACAVASASALALAAFTTATTGTARASSNVPADYVVASFPVAEGSQGIASLFTYMEAELCLPPPPSEIGLEFCDSLPNLLISPLVANGTTTWTDGSNPYFDNIVSEITNGVSGPLEAEVRASNGAFGSSYTATELDLFGDQVGPSGVDLAGYRIDRIGFRVDEITIDSPGSDPNGDGIWTDFSLRGAFVFEGTIASRKACKNGGWRSLHGPGGSSFKNQGECIDFVDTGQSAR
jgi:hypothetical protein